MISEKLKNFLRLESSGGILLIFSTALAMIVVNLPFENYYHLLLEIPIEIRISNFYIAKPLLLWVNDGLMALFFLLIGLEIKREFIDGELSNKKNIILPAIAAIGGMIVPSIIYYLLNKENSIALSGWAIPAATDIAFALGILALIGNKVPTSLKLFLLTLAIIDDLGAIIIIAIFYSSQLSFIALAIAIISIFLLFILNKRRVMDLTPYILVGVVLWIALLKSGAHATLAGIILAFFIPCSSNEEKNSPLHKLEHDLHPTVTFFILPLFAFVNTGISFSNFSLNSLTNPISLGISLGLIFGKQIGIFSFTWIAVKLKIAQLPKEITWKRLYGLSALCGIGFTMSLFISSLAFGDIGTELAIDERVGIVFGSIISAIWGYLVLKSTVKKEITSTMQ